MRWTEEGPLTAITGGARYHLERVTTRNEGSEAQASNHPLAPGPSVRRRSSPPLDHGATGRRVLHRAIAGDEDKFMAHLNLHPLIAELGMPTATPIGLLSLENIDPLGRRLAGYRWLLVGRVAPYPREDPPWPALLAEPAPGQPGLALQVWCSRIWHGSSPLYGEMRWHPARGGTVWIGGLEHPHGERDYTLARRGLRLISQRLRPGRPPASVYFDNPEECRAALLTVMRRLRQQGRVVTQQAVSAYFDYQISDRTVRRWLQEFGLSWEALVREAEHDGRSD